MESGLNLLLIIGPVVAVAITGAVAASALAFWQYGWRGWKISLVFTLMAATALVVTFLAVNNY